MDQPRQTRCNRLLELLGQDVLDQTKLRFNHVRLEYKHVLYEARKPIEFVYFPLSGVASMVNIMADGSAAEVGTIGNEGVVGLPIILGDTVPANSVYIQVPGAALWGEASVFQDALEHSPPLRKLTLQYAHVFFNQVAQTAACNHFHSVEQRCCRWLLMTHDRVQSDRFLLTQEFLGMMLGVQRTSVTGVATNLKRQKLIEYSRGHVTILNRKGLEQSSCECYAATKAEFDRLLGPPSGLG